MLQHETDAQGGGDDGRGRDIRHNVEGLGLRLSAYRLGRQCVIGVPGDDMDADVAGMAHQIAHHRAVDHLEPARALGLADDDMGDVVGLRVAGHILGDASAGNGDGLAAEFLGKPETVGDAVAIALVETLVARGFDEKRGPGAVQPVGQPLGIANQGGTGRILADANQHPLARGPRAADGMRLHVGQHLLVDALGGAPERQFAQRGQIAGLKIMADGARGLFGDIDLAFLETLNQVVGRKIDDLDIVGPVEHAVGHGLAHADAGDLRHHVVEAFDVLDVERGEDVDARDQQFLNVEIALRVTRAGSIGVREFVDQHQFWPARQDGVEIHFLDATAFVVDGAPLHGLEAGQQRLGFLAAVGLDDADDEIDAFAALGLRRLKHFIGLADPRRGAEENLQPAAAFLLGLSQQRLGRRARIRRRVVRRGHAPL